MSSSAPKGGRTQLDDSGFPPSRDQISDRFKFSSVPTAQDTVSRTPLSNFACPKVQEELAYELEDEVWESLKVRLRQSLATGGFRLSEGMLNVVAVPGS